MAPLAMLPSWQLRHIMMPAISSGIVDELGRRGKVVVYVRAAGDVVALGQAVAIQRTKVLAPQSVVTGIGRVQ